MNLYLLKYGDCDLNYVLAKDMIQAIKKWQEANEHKPTDFPDSIELVADSAFVIK